MKMVFKLRAFILCRISLRLYFRKYSQIPLRPSYRHLFLLLPSLIKNFPSSFSSVTRFIRVNRISSSIISVDGDLPAISLLIIVAPKDFEKLETCIAKAVKHSLNPISKIEIVVPNNGLTSCLKIVDQIDSHIPIYILNEDEIISAELREKMILELKHKYGWALQQIITLQMVIDSKSHGVLAVNADTFILRNQVWLNKKFVQLLFQSPEFHKPYYKVIKGLFPGLNLIPYSHVTHHMLFQPDLMRDFLAKNNYTDIECIMYRVLMSFDKFQESPFCLEFEPYGQALHHYYPDRFELRRFSNSSFSANEVKIGARQFIEDLDNENIYNSISFHSWSN